jgi:phosphopantothenoylcysteine decarboxylase/phosphopantothenate--cysteine ligase
MLEKEVDAICYNLLTDKNGFGSDDNEMTFIDKKREILLKRSPKVNIAIQICEICKELDNE